MKRPAVRMCRCSGQEQELGTVPVALDEEAVGAPNPAVGVGAHTGQGSAGAADDASAAPEDKSRN